jgi:hypothetical protein
MTFHMSAKCISASRALSWNDRSASFSSLVSSISLAFVAGTVGLSLVIVGMVCVLCFAFVCLHQCASTALITSSIDDRR